MNKLHYRDSFDVLKRTFVLLSILYLSLNNLTYGQSWTQITATGTAPAPRYGQTGCYDVANNRMIVFGGNISGSLTNEVWVLTNADGTGGTPTWIQLSPTGTPPSGRYTLSSVYDSSSNRLIIFAGYDGFTWLNDVWVLSNANGLDSTTSTWTQLSPTGGPPSSRSGPSAVYDSNNNIMIIFGGDVNNNGYNDVWTLTNANGLGGTPSWTQLLPTGSLPTTRGGHTAIYDSNNNIMTIFGGNTSGSSMTLGISLNDTWVLTHANGLGGTPAWLQLSPTGNLPTPRFGQIAVSNTTKNCMVIYGGGISGSTCLDDAWLLTNANGLGGTPAWNQILPTNSNPTARELLCATYNPNSDNMTVFGGLEYPNVNVNDIWILNMATAVPVELSRFEAIKE